MNSNISKSVLILVTIMMLVSCMDKGSGNHFYVKYEDGKYIYHSNQYCSKLDGSFDDFDLYNIRQDDGKIAPYGFCSRCMDDEFIEKCEEEIKKESTPHTSKIEEDSLVVYCPDYSRIDLVCGTMPSAKDTNVIYCAEAAFTGELLKEFKHSNIAGKHVSGGKQYNGYSCKRNTGAFVYYKGKYKFLYKDYANELAKAADNGGMGFGQEMIIHNGKLVESLRKDNNTNMFRALCEKYGKLYVIDSKEVIAYGDFKKALLDYEVTEAIYLDMGTGWNYSWYRDIDGKVNYIHNHRIAFTTNWLTFYK